MDIQAISSCACHGKICTHCSNAVAVLQLIGDQPRQQNLNPPTYESLCQECAVRFAGELFRYARTKPYKTLAEVKERQGIRS